MSKSSSGDWDEARLEWEITGMDEDFEKPSCICGHTPIKECYNIRNKVTGQELFPVGNVCIKKFSSYYMDEMTRAIAMTKRTMTTGKFEGKTYGYIIKNCHWYIKFLKKTQTRRKAYDKLLWCSEVLPPKLASKVC